MVLLRLLLFCGGDGDAHAFADDDIHLYIYLSIAASYVVAASFVFEASSFLSRARLL